MGYSTLRGSNMACWKYLWLHPFAGPRWEVHTREVPWVFYRVQATKMAIFRFKQLKYDDSMGVTGKLKREHQPRTRAGVEPWIFQPCLMTLKGIIHFRLHIPLYPHITLSRLQHDVGIRLPENGWFFRCFYANGCYESNSQGSLDKSSKRSATWSHINPIKSVFHSQYSKNPIIIDGLLILYLE